MSQSDENLRARVGEFARFATVGVINTLVTLAITHGLRLFVGVPLGPASVVGYAAGVATSFALNRGWTFSTTVGPVTSQLVGFLVLNAIGAALYAGVGVLLASKIGPFGASIVGTGCAFVLNYLGCRYVVFRPRQPAAPDAR